MGLTIQSVKDESFKPFGRIVEGYDYTELLKVLEDTTPKPEDAVIYVPSDAKLEATPAFIDLQANCYGGMPIQIGYCNGNNTKLNCLEYHRDSEINIAADDMILLLAQMKDVTNGKLDTSTVQAFLCPKGTAVEVYATSLHYAPCNAKRDSGFRVAIVLPKYTNEEKPVIAAKNDEDALLWAKNKWLIAHPESSEAAQGAHPGLIGENIDIADLI